MAKVCVLGAGGWGIALAITLEKNGHEVWLWSKLEREVTALQETRENKNSLPGILIPETIQVTNDMQKAVSQSEMVILAVASSYIRSTSASLKEYIQENQILLNVAKGIENHTLYTMTQIIEEEIPTAKVAVLSGPSHAEEVGRGLPTTCVVGAKEKESAEKVQNLFSNSFFRVYTNPDVLGIELGAALKNVIALAAGIADGLGYGDNTKAAIITRGIYEISNLGVAIGGKVETFFGLSGIGDLVVTCASMHSRNRRAGILIGKGYTLEEAEKEVHMVVEGAVSARAAYQLAKKHQVSVPIVEQVYRVLFEGQPAKEAVQELMLRDKKIENYALNPGNLW